MNELDVETEIVRMERELEREPMKLYVGRWVDIVDGVRHEGEGQASWEEHCRRLLE